MGGQEKPKGDRLHSVRRALHEKPSKSEALRRFVSKLTKDDTTASRLRALAAVEGIEKLTAEAKRLGLIEEDDPGNLIITSTPRAIDGGTFFQEVAERERRAIDRALEQQVFKSEWMGSFLTEAPESKPIDMSTKPLTFEDMEEGMRRAKAMDDRPRDDTVDAFTYAAIATRPDKFDRALAITSRRSGKTAALRAAMASGKMRIRGKSYPMAFVDEPRSFMPPDVTPPTDPIEMVLRWAWMRTTTPYLLEYMKRYASGFDAMHWGELGSYGLGNALASLQVTITDKEQKKRCEANMARVVESFRKLVIDVVTAGKSTDIDWEDNKDLVRAMLNGEPEWLPRDSFQITKTIRMDIDVERYRVIYTTPGPERQYVASEIRFDTQTLRQMAMSGPRRPYLKPEDVIPWEQQVVPGGSALQHPRANLPEGPPEEMADQDFASAFQAWTNDDD